MQYDERLSNEALGALARLERHPGENPLTVLQGPGGWGRDKARAVLRELRERGFVELTVPRDERGRLSSVYRILRPPETPGAGRSGPGASSSNGHRTTQTPAPVNPPTRGREAVSSVVTALAVPTQPLELSQEQLLAPVNGNGNGKARARDPIWDAFVELYGEPTAPSRKAWNQAAKDLRDYGAAAADIVAFFHDARAAGNDKHVQTPNALAKHFGSRELLSRIPAAPDRAGDLLRRAMRE